METTPFESQRLKQVCNLNTFLHHHHHTTYIPSPSPHHLFFHHHHTTHLSTITTPPIFPPSPHYPSFHHHHTPPISLHHPPYTTRIFPLSFHHLPILPPSHHHQQYSTVFLYIMNYTPLSSHLSFLPHHPHTPFHFLTHKPFSILTYIFPSHSNSFSPISSFFNPPFHDSHKAIKLPNPINNPPTQLTTPPTQLTTPPTQLTTPQPN